MTPHTFSRIRIGTAPAVAMLAAAAVAAGCGGGDGPSADDAQSNLNAFDKAAVASHNAVTPKFERTRDCAAGKSYVTLRECIPAAKTYVAALEREQRKLQLAYDKAPDYVRRIYRDFYRAHRMANEADLLYGKAVLEFTRSSKTLDVARGQRAIAALNRAVDRSARLDSRTQRLLRQARDESDVYVKSL